MYILKVDGQKIPMRDKPSLKEIQDAVGGHIELAMTTDGGGMYINEEGKLNDLPVNQEASKLYSYFGYDVIVGDVVVMSEAELQAESEEGVE